MSSDTCKLSDIADVQGGFAFKSADFSDTGVAVVKIANIQPPSVSLANVDRIAPDKLKGLERFELLDGDILMAMTGATVGKAGRFRLTEPAYLNQRVARISAKKGHLFDDFLYAVVSLPGFDNLIEGASAGSAQANISAAGIGSVVIPKLSDSEQIQIGCIARMLDDRMALLRETNATLEAIAQALFKSWFVDFDPVHARARGEQPAGLAPELAALFPDSFEESALGLVPKGWKYVSLKEATDIFDSKRIPLAGQERAKRKGPYPYYGAAALMDWVDDYIFDGVYLLMGEDGSVADASGYPITQYVWGKIWVNNHAHVLQGRNGISTEHLMLALKGVNIQPFITGAVQAKLSQSNMWRIQFLMPTQSVASAFADLISPMFAKIRANSEQAQTLANLRDTLLPRLISGQLRLPDAEAQLSEVGLCQ
ncbi:restriction endonuclease subunit S [Aeromonas veronii]|uniref:restriction endonuclease subunit S n=1 Tax=Aeromonas veronii TaxID=654 RepID=UPI003B9F2DBD